MSPSQDIIVEKKNKSYWITFNRPHRRNAIAGDGYETLINALVQSAHDPDTLFTVFTGTGDIYSSGNEFSVELLNAGAKALSRYARFIDHLIDHQKVIVALVNGPAIGVACTMLSCCDYVIAAQHAYFLCPFTAMGLLPEGTSSKSFSALMGYPQAARMALFSEKFTADEALSFGFISRIMPSANFSSEASKVVQRFENSLAPESLLMTKKLLRDDEWRQKMHDANNKEENLLLKKMHSKETMNLIARKFGSKM